jgi:hypothetical protein
MNKMRKKLNALRNDRFKKLSWKTTAKAMAKKRENWQAFEIVGGDGLNYVA